MEKSRVLQEALHALATEHHELEQSIAVRKPSTQRYYDTDEDEFYDCDEENLENTEGLYICLSSLLKKIWIKMLEKPFFLCIICTENTCMQVQCFSSLQFVCFDMYCIQMSDKYYSLQIHSKQLQKKCLNW